MLSRDVAKVRVVWGLGGCVIGIGGWVEGRYGSIYRACEAGKRRTSLVDWAIWNSVWVIGIEIECLPITCKLRRMNTASG
jgi:hypothetical protein